MQEFPLFAERSAPPLSCRDMECHGISLELAKAANRKWHSTLPRFGTGCVEAMKFPAFGATHGGVLFAVAIWSHPVARLLPQHEWLELRRLAISEAAPKFTASWMIGQMVKSIKRTMRHVERLISYQDCDAHSGTIYKASGWTATTRNNDGNWDRPNRSRPQAQRPNAKQRWELAVR
jgi:hypothetical protein